MKDDAVPAAAAALSNEVTTISAQVAGLATELAQTRAAILKGLDRLETSIDELRAEANARRSASP